MTRASRFASAALAVATIAFTTACGADEAPAPAPAKTQKADKAELKPWRDAIGKKKMVKIGERVFQTKGSNTCNDCHGKDGKKGRLEQAADLTQPSTWRASKALGGDQVCGGSGGLGRLGRLGRPGGHALFAHELYIQLDAWRVQWKLRS